MAGSLIKNPGGGLVPSGGYFAGRKDLVEKISYRMTLPGLGRKWEQLWVRTDFFSRAFYGASCCCREPERCCIYCSDNRSLALKHIPAPFDTRCDLIQAIKFNREDAVIAFARVYKRVHR